MRGISVVRRLLNTKSSRQISVAASYGRTLVPGSAVPSSTQLLQKSSRNNNFTNPNDLYQFSHLCRNFCSSSSGPSNLVLVESEEQFKSSIRNAKDNSQPAIYYFTAVWCPPCKLLAPIIRQLSEKYPHVTTYKIDIDQKGLESVLSDLQINSVPTLHFFHNGKKASEVVGADVETIRTTMEKLYK